MKRFEADIEKMGKSIDDNLMRANNDCAKIVKSASPMPSIQSIVESEGCDLVRTTNDLLIDHTNHTKSIKQNYDAIQGDFDQIVRTELGALSAMGENEADDKHKAGLWPTRARCERIKTKLERNIAVKWRLSRCRIR